MIIQLLFCLSLFFANQSIAQDIQEYIFTPKVEFPKLDFNTVQITAENYSFETTYSKEDEQFHPIDIPFNVESSLSYALSYSIAVTSAKYRCYRSLEDNGDVSWFDGVNTTITGLDGKNNALVPAKEGENKGKNTHTLKVSFNDIIPQRYFEQHCDGVIGIQLEAAI